MLNFDGNDDFNVPFLLANFRSLITLSRERGLCPFRDDDSLELDESDDPDSDALESDEFSTIEPFVLLICDHQ